MTEQERWKLISQGWLRYLTPDERLVLAERIGADRRADVDAARP